MDVRAEMDDDDVVDAMRYLIFEWRARVGWTYVPFEFNQVINLTEHCITNNIATTIETSMVFFSSFVRQAHDLLPEAKPGATREQANYLRLLTEGTSVSIRNYLEHAADPTARGRIDACRCLIKVWDDLYSRLNKHQLWTGRPGADQP